MATQTRNEHKVFLTSAMIVLALAAIIFLFITVFMMGRQQGAVTQTQQMMQLVSPAPTEKQTGLANPASVNCINQGGKLVMKSNGAGEYGLCQFEDNQACEEWALFRGQCPVGGVKTTGFDNIEQKYCAWSGGQTTATKNAKCTLPDGKVCDDIDFYNGHCQ